MRRRDFIALIGGDAVAWPLVLRAQQATMPLIGYLSSVGRNDRPKVDDAFRQGVAEAGLIEGQSVVIEYRYADGHCDRLPRSRCRARRRHCRSAFPSERAANEAIQQFLVIWQNHRTGERSIDLLRWGLTALQVPSLARMMAARHPSRQRAAA
jgi:hypothetical protein